jgi:cytidyltransferase-like protein
MTTNFLLEGGVAGHMSHLYDNYELSFSQIKDIFTAAADGELEGTEKTDGQNLFISFDVSTGKAKGARNKGNIKDGGLDAKQLSDKFGGRGALEFTFTEALNAFEEAVNLLTPIEQEEIFGPNTNIYYNCEIQDPRTANVINYDVKTLSIHRLGGAEFDRETGDKTDRDVTENAEKLADALQRVQSQKKSAYNVQFDAIRRLQELEDRTVLDNALDRIEAAISSYGISDNQTVGDYVVARIEDRMEKEVPVPDELKAKIIKRILGSKEVGLAALKKEFSSLAPEITEKIISMIKEPGFVLSDAIRPIEEIVHDFSVEMLKTLESAFVIDNKKEVLRLRNELARAISAIESSGSEEAMSILKKQMEKLKSIENVSTAAEGFVFAYDGHSYKFTGNFAPMNQLLGLFKYGRGNVPPLQKLDEALLIEIVAEDSRSIAIFPGSFKPPHRGHMAVVEYLADKFDKVLVFVSAPVSPKSIRSDLKASDAVEIFNIYISEAGLSDRAMATISPMAAPIVAAFQFAEKENFDPPANISFVTSEKDADRFNQAALDKTKAKNPTLVGLDSIILPAIAGPQGAVSARQLRAIISDPEMDREEKEEALISYLPAYLSENAREMVFNILMPEDIVEIELSTSVEEAEIQEMSGMSVGSVAGPSQPLRDQ